MGYFGSFEIKICIFVLLGICTLTLPFLRSRRSKRFRNHSWSQSRGSIWTKGSLSRILIVSVLPRMKLFICVLILLAPATLFSVPNLTADTVPSTRDARDLSWGTLLFSFRIDVGGSNHLCKDFSITKTSCSSLRWIVGSDMCNRFTPTDWRIGTGILLIAYTSISTLRLRWLDVMQMIYRTNWRRATFLFKKRWLRILWTITRSNWRESMREWSSCRGNSCRVSWRRGRAWCRRLGDTGIMTLLLQWGIYLTRIREILIISLSPTQ